MANLQNNIGSPAAARSEKTVQGFQNHGESGIDISGMDPTWNEPWTGMDTRFRTDQERQMSPTGQMGQIGGMNQIGQTGGSSQLPQSNGLNMRNNLPYLDSMKSILNNNKGNFIVASFLIGTQNTMTWEGVLYDVGNDYVTIYQPGRDRYVVIDMYSLKHMEFYDTQRRELCNQLFQEQVRNMN